MYYKEGFVERRPEVFPELYHRDVVVVRPGTDLLFTTDVQGAFLPDGGLGVPGSDAILPFCDRNIQKFRHAYCDASVDRHLRGSISLVTSYVGYKPKYELTLAEVEGWLDNKRIAPHALFSWAQLRNYLRMTESQSQVLWDEHALEGASESEIHPLLAKHKFRRILVKGLNPIRDCNSPFQDNAGYSTGLLEEYKNIGIKRIFNQGLVEEVCVGLGSLHAAAKGFEVFVIADATYALNIGESQAKIRERFRKVGVKLIYSDQIQS